MRAHTATLYIKVVICVVVGGVLCPTVAPIKLILRVHFRHLACEIRARRIVVTRNMWMDAERKINREGEKEKKNCCMGKYVSSMPRHSDNNVHKALKNTTKPHKRRHNRGEKKPRENKRRRTST